MIDIYPSDDSNEYPTRFQALSDCPNRRGEFRCASLSCPWCAHTEAKRTALAIGRQEPLAMITLTNVGRAWQQARLAMKAAGRKLRQICDFGWAWIREENQSGQESHIHVWITGEVPELGDLQDAASRAGMGERVDISLTVPSATPVQPNYRKGIEHVGAFYGFKSIISSPQGSIASQEGLEGHLRLNGDRLVHTSRGFFRDAEGRPQTLSEAIRDKSAYRPIEPDWKAQ